MVFLGKGLEKSVETYQIAINLEDGESFPTLGSTFVIGNRRRIGNNQIYPFGHMATRIGSE